MAQTIKLRRSSTSGAVPTTSSLSLGEVAINTYDGKMYIKKNDGADAIVELSGDKLPLSGGTLTGNLNLGDNVRARFGADNDLQIYHDGSNSYINDTGTGALYIKSNYLAVAGANGHQLINAEQGAAVELFHNNTRRISTTSYGVDITGRLVTTSHIDAPDSARIRLGDGDDLQFFHDGSNSFINNVGGGSGTLSIKSHDINLMTSASETMATFAEDGAVTLYHNNSAKIATTSTGINVTGTVTADGLVVDGGGSRQYVNAGHLRLSNDYKLEWGGGTNFITGNNSTGAMSLTATENLTLDVAGNIVLNADAGGVYFYDGATEIGLLANTGNNFVLMSRLEDKDIIFKGKDGSSTITALTLDMSDAGVALFNSDIRLVDNAVIRLGDGQDFRLWHDGNHNTIQSTLVDSDIYIKGNDGGSTITMLGFDTSAGGAATFSGSVTSTGLTSSGDALFQGNVTHNNNNASSKYFKLNVASSGDGHLLLQRNNTNYWQIHSDSSNVLKFDGYNGASSAVFSGSVTSTGASGGNLFLTSTDTSGATGEVLGNINFVSGDASTGSSGTMAKITSLFDSNGDNAAIKIQTGFSTGSGSPTLRDRALFASNGDVSLYEDTGTTAKLFWDASAERLGLGTTAPLSALNVKGTQGQWRVDPDSVSNHVEILSTNTANTGFLNLRLRTNDFIVQTGGADRLTLNSSGNATFSGSISSGAITADTGGTAQNALDIGGPSASNYTIQRWLTSAHSGNEAYLIAYGASHVSEAGNFAIKNVEAGKDIFFELASSVQPLRLTSTGATFSGSVSTGSGGASGKIAITGGTATGEQAHTTFTNTQGAKTYAIGGGQSGVTNNGFVIRNVTDNTFPLVISDAGASTFSGSVTSTGNVSVGGSAYTTSADLNLLGDGLAIKNDKAGNSNNWSFIQNTDTGNASNLSFTTGLGVALTLNHNKSASFGANVNIPNGGLMVGATTAPEGQLTLQNDDASLRIRSNTTTTKGLTLKYNHAGNFGQLLVDHQGVNQLDMKYYALSHTFGRSDSLKFMTIDSSGRLYLGTTSTTPAFSTSTGMHFAPAGESMISGGNNTTLFLNRTTGDGSILDFRKNGGMVGSIGTNSGYMVIGSPVGSDAHLLIGNNLIHPATSTGAAKDDFIVLGSSTNRFTDLHLSGISYSAKNRIGTTATIASSGEVLSVKSLSSGHSAFENNDAGNGTLYIENKETTANSYQPAIIIKSGGGNRGNIGVEYSTSKLGIAGHAGISLRTGSTSLNAATEQFSISSTGEILMSGGSLAIAATAPGDSLVLRSNEVVVNQNSLDLDFRVESDNDTHALFVQGDTGNVGIGTASPQHELVVASTGNTTLGLVGSGYDDAIAIRFGGGDLTNTLGNGNSGAAIISQQSVSSGQAKGDLRFQVNGGDLLDTAMYIGTSGTVDVSNDLLANNAKLKAIAESKSVTALDVFVYDTSKDSDGGAWRHRTQHTSWYNETLNTSTRGATKKFPAVAVLVVTSGKVTIYDGDEPSMPMWMVFNSGGGSFSDHTMLGQVGSNNRVAVRNAVMGVSARGGQTLVLIDFLKETSEILRSSNDAGMRGFHSSKELAKRNAQSGEHEGTIRQLISNQGNDIAMTVLPTAPIDADTGLPVPTIAVATDGGVSVIKDDGTIASQGLGGSIGYIASNIDFVGTGQIIVGRNTYGTGNRHSHLIDIDNLSSTTNANAAVDFVDITSYTGASNQVLPVGNMSGAGVVGLNSEEMAYVHGNKSFYKFLNDGSTASKGSVAKITSDYNTGWMNGDIKLATLSDTDDTNVTGSELVTNGDFSNGTTGWTAPSGSGNTNSLTVNGSGQGVWAVSLGDYWLSQPVSLIAGKTYVVSVDRISSTTNTWIRIGSSTNGNADLLDAMNFVSGKAYSFTVPVGYTSGSWIQLGVQAGSGNNAVFDNISVSQGEEDRSVNGNGLQVFGTVTKTAVATGADLVAYSGFSSSNYLQQPYNSDLDFGTGDFSYSFWHSCTFASPDRLWLAHGKYNTAGSGLSILQLNSSGSGDTTLFYLGASSAGSVTVNNVEGLGFQQWVVTRRNGVLYVYRNGKLEGSVANTSSVNLSAQTIKELYLGAAYTGSSVFAYGAGPLALFRISATAPTAEQIAKMYNDEKFLFQDNAKATLYGSSDEVTALAYDDDTELLHAGTSAGRSEFQGLRRVDNTTDAVGAAISASNGFIVED